MKILIVGSTSVIGRALKERLAGLGDVTMAGRRDAEIQMDLADPKGVLDINELFDVVVHVAADFGGESDDDIVRSELVNAVGALSVCRVAQQAKAKHLLHLSTISATYRATDPFFGIYALSKRHGEEAVRFYCAQKGMPLTILRPTQIYDDAGECRQHQKFLYAIADQAQAGKDVQIYGGNDALRNYLHIEDLAEICCRVVERRLLGEFTCAFPTSVHLSEIANAAFAAFGKGGQVRFVRDRPDIPDLPPIGDKGPYDLLGFSPTIDIASGLARIARHRGGKI